MNQINTKKLIEIISKTKKDFAIRNFRLMVGTEYSGQERLKIFIESAILWYNKKNEIFSKLGKCYCNEGLELRDFIYTNNEIIFIYKCDNCICQKSFRYKRGVNF